MSGDDLNPNIDTVYDNFEQAWLDGKSPPLEEIPEAKSDDVFEELLRIELDMLARRDARPSVDEYAKRFPHRQGTVQRVFSERDSAAIPYAPPPVPVDSPHDLEDGTASVTAKLQPGDRVGDYDIIDVVGSGGMGVVYRAHDQKLGRTVALKLIRADFDSASEQVARFRVEAQAAARLDHPGIVPVHDVGELNGTPFYSMSFVDGQSLSQLVREHPLEQRRAAEIACRLAEAVHYAHQHKVIHRDLKPQNVLMDGDQPRVTDFGLARIEREDSDLTSHGQVLGTPNYMPPEQAAGRLDDVDVRADVYALGAVLYRVLVGRPPFQASTSVETLRQVLDQEPVPLRQLNSAIARDLETICMRCLSKARDRRFASAGDLAADLQRFLDGMPIHSRPIGTFERARLWCRRRPALATAMVLLIAVTVVGTSLVTWKWREAEAAKVDAELAKSEAVVASRLAEANLKKAADAVNQFFHTIADSRLLNTPGLQPLRKDLLEMALQYQHDFIEANGERPGLAEDLADAQRIVAEIRNLLGDRDKAIAEFRKANRFIKRVIELEPNFVEARMDRIAVLQQLGRALQKKGELDAAYEVLLEAKQEAESVVNADLTHPDKRDLQAGAHFAIAGLLEERGDFEAADFTYRQAIRIRRELARDHRSNTLFQFNLAAVLQNFAIVQRSQLVARMGQADTGLVGAASSLEEAIQIYESISLTHKDRSVVKEQQLMSMQHLAVVVGELGDLEREDELTAELVKQWQSLCDANPDVPRYQISLLIAHRGRCFAKLIEGDSKEALKSGLLAVEVGRQLRVAQPNDREAATELADAWEKVGLAHQQLQQDQQAINAYQSALALLRPILARGDSSHIAERTSGVLLNLGTAEELVLGVDAAAKSFQESCEIARQLTEQHPDVPQYFSLLSMTLRNLGHVTVEMGDEAAGLKMVKESLDLLRERHSSKASHRPFERDLIEALQAAIELHLELKNAEKAGKLIVELTPMLEVAARRQDDLACHLELAVHRSVAAGSLTDAGRIEDACMILRKGIDDLSEFTKRTGSAEDATELLEDLRTQLSELR